MVSNYHSTIEDPNVHAHHPIQTLTRAQNQPQSRTPATQSSPIFKLPDELIISLPSYTSPAPRHSDHIARFRVQYDMTIDNRHQEWMKLLRTLSMTCKKMRFRLIPWIWERLELFPQHHCASESENIRYTGMVFDIVKGDEYLAPAVKFLTVTFTLKGPHVPLFVKCLGALPNLHTLEITEFDNSATEKLRTALQGIELPQIKTLILPVPAHPLLEHCRGAEDVVCVTTRLGARSDAFFRSLAFNRDSKVRRLAIPLTGWRKVSRLAQMCPRLTELTVLYPLPRDFCRTEDGLLSDTAEAARAAMSEILSACKVLPGFDTLQIAHLFASSELPLRSLSKHLGYDNKWDAWDDLKRIFLEEVRTVRDTAIDALKQMDYGGEKGEGGKVALTVIALEWGLDFEQGRLGGRVLESVKVEKY